ncbi:ATP-binding protein [Bacteroides stercorirosoris]|jgi:biotin carboxylase|uniref:Biotin carboxylase n=1 Tax=Bacteroides stercorirosoris TaxID=871324 RepID=A0A1M6AV82_9BACE|nr:ATP-grasp domain-containing protein [Bacteroides stercorirosoris]SHI40385.1 Biotin carboxylase [Bacteroides stercorirosoris]
MVKKILLLGGSAQQVVAIETAKEMGYYTVLCDYLPDNPGRYVADKYYNISTTDIDAVYDAALSEGVDGILAYASDPAAFPASIVAERLGLPTNPSVSVEILGVKHKFRNFLRTHDFACPQVYTFHPSQSLDAVMTAIKNFNFPIVVKPTDSSGSKGVTMLDNSNELGAAVAYADIYSRNKILIIEEFITRGFPAVIGGDIFVWDGKIVLYGEMACLRGGDGKGLIPIGKRRPGGLNAFQERRIHEELQRLISLLDIRFGELNIEVLLDKDDDIYFLEVGPRAGGNMIPLQLSDIFGVDLVKANVVAAMGSDPGLHVKNNTGCYMTYVLHSSIDGVYDRIDFADEILPYIYRKVLYKKRGDRVEAFDGAGKALGIIFLRSDTATRMNWLCERMDELIKVKLKS